MLLGIAGPPGAGKSTLARALVSAFASSSTTVAQNVPMDGFHLADEELQRLGRLQRKGAPDTFDVQGYRALLARLRDAFGQETVYAPSFDREIEQPVAGAIPVGPQVGLVVSEGNYLLDEEPVWRAVRAQFDEVWWVDAPSEAREQRLIARHEMFGKSPQDARVWVREVDGANTRRVAQGRNDADLVVPGDLVLPSVGQGLFKQDSGPVHSESTITHDLRLEVHG